MRVCTLYMNRILCVQCAYYIHNNIYMCVCIYLSLQMLKCIGTQLRYNIAVPE